MQALRPEDLEVPHSDADGMTEIMLTKSGLRIRYVTMSDMPVG
jgi:hypothetical protein